MKSGLGRKQYLAALYMRLSKEDGTSESASIAAQRKLLRAYALENGYTVAGEYADDGWSGTSFERPAFMRMISDIEARKVNMVITKDFSRLGRDYIIAGQYTEMYFPEHNVRYIAINDGYDSSNPVSDIAPFRHVINEMYARDTSKKIRSAFQTKMREGSYIGNFAPYGFKKDPDNKNHLILDPEAASVVREIFNMALSGSRPSEIAAFLNQNDIASPAIYRCRAYPHLNPGNYTTRGEWTSATICKMLSNTVYIGHTAQGKTSKASLKSKTTIRKPRGEWYVVENTHDPIVTQQVFELVGKRSIARRNDPKTDFRNVFSGVAKCADCGANMSIAVSGKNESRYKLVCGRYKLYGSGECSNHFVGYSLLYQAALSEVRVLLTLSDEDKKLILSNLKSFREPLTDAKLTAALEARDKELDYLIRRIYEDNAGGKISDVRFAKLNALYESEQHEIIRRIEALKMNDDQKSAVSCNQFGAYLDGLSSIKSLTPCLIKFLIDRIEVGQGSWEQKKKRQDIRIFWRFSEG